MRDIALDGNGALWMPLDTIKTYSEILKLYDLVCCNRDVEASFYASFMETGRDLLEVGCGTGMLSDRLQRLGYQVSGIDTSPEMLTVCNQRCPEVDAVLADMRNFDLGMKFDLVTIPYNTLSHLMTEEDVIKTFRCMRRHCQPTGRFIFSLHHHSDDHHEMFTVHEGVNRFFDEQSGEISTIIRAYRIDPVERFLTMLWSVMSPDLSITRREHFINTRLYSNSEIVEYLAQTGFEVESCFENELKAPFTEKSLKQIFVAKPIA